MARPVATESIAVLLMIYGRSKIHGLALQMSEMAPPTYLSVSPLRTDTEGAAHTSVLRDAGKRGLQHVYTPQAWPIVLSEKLRRGCGNLRTVMDYTMFPVRDVRHANCRPCVYRYSLYRVGSVPQNRVGATLGVALARWHRNSVVLHAIVGIASLGATEEVEIIPIHP